MDATKKFTHQNSPTEIFKAIDECQTKAEYWFDKKIGGGKGYARINAELWERIRKEKTRGACSPVIDYTDKNGNRWISFQIVHNTIENWTRHENVMVIIYDTDEGAGLMDIMEGNDKRVYCYTPHLFKQMFDVAPYNPEAPFLQNYQDFCVRNPVCKTGVLGENKEAVGALLYYDFMLKADIEIEGEYEKWIVNDCELIENVDFDSSKELMELKQEYDKLYNDFYSIDDDAFDANKASALSMSNTDIKILAEDYKRTNTGELKGYPINLITTYIGLVADAVYTASGKNIMSQYFHAWNDADKQFFFHELDKWAKQSVALAARRNLDEETYCAFNKESTIEVSTKLLWHFSYDISREEVADALAKTPAWKIYSENQITNNLMDKKTREQLRSTLKKNGLRDKYENLIKSTRTTVEAYLDNVQPIYAISRLHKYITNDKDVSKFIEADKQWIAIVINEDKCAMIAPYVEKYSKQEVIQAIGYLLDNNLWEAPLGIENIRKPTPDDFKGLEAITEAIEYLRAEGLVKEEPELLPIVDEETTETSDTPATGKRTNAQNAFKECFEMFDTFVDKFGILSDYFEKDDLPDLLEAENKKLEKENTRLEESIKTVNQQLKEANKEIERQKQAEYEARKERNQKIDDFNKLRKQYEDMKGDYEFLKREAQKAKDIPAYKVIPLSKLSSLPLVGAKLLSTLIPFLKNYGVQIDERR